MPTSTPKGPGSVSEPERLASPDGTLTVVTETEPLWRIFSSGIRPGTSRRTGDNLEWSVGPEEATVRGPRPEGDDVVDLTHVRMVFRLTGPHATRLLAKICALDLDDTMFPEGAAARTLVAGVATEIVREDCDGVPSYLLLPSRSFGRYLSEVLADAGREFGLEPHQP